MKFSNTLNLLSFASVMMGQVEGRGYLKSMTTDVDNTSEAVGELFDAIFDVCEYDSADFEESNLRARTKQTARVYIHVEPTSDNPDCKDKNILKASENRKLMNHTPLKIRFEKGLMNSDDVLRSLQDCEASELSCIVLDDAFDTLNDVLQMEADEIKTDSLKYTHTDKVGVKKWRPNYPTVFHINYEYD